MPANRHTADWLTFRFHEASQFGSLVIVNSYTPLRVVVLWAEMQSRLAVDGGYWKLDFSARLSSQRRRVYVRA